MSVSLLLTEKRPPQIPKEEHPSADLRTASSTQKRDAVPWRLSPWLDPPEDRRRPAQTGLAQVRGLSAGSWNSLCFVCASKTLPDPGSALPKRLSLLSVSFSSKKTSPSAAQTYGVMGSIFSRAPACVSPPLSPLPQLLWEAPPTFPGSLWATTELPVSGTSLTPVRTGPTFTL